MEQNQVPDLASVLRTLASFAPLATSQASPHPGVPTEDFSAQYQPDQPSLLPGLGIHPHGYTGSNGAPPSGDVIQEALPPRDPQLQPQPQHRTSIPPPSTVAEGTATSLIDPASITEWRQGLRCVNKVSAQNPSFKRVIQHMMAEQLKHEQEWYKGRAELQRRQASRVQGNQQLDSILKSVGAIPVAQAKAPTAHENEAELKAYDVKVYRAMKDMNNAQAIELKRLGVPFFGVPLELIKDSDDDASIAPQRPGLAAGPKITETELLDLQRRMIEYLEDMYKE
ncbi:hypothetical protein H2201_001865 [Coniosporium apollinis]|uniref:Uncharacterized protein n=1 Tax=Coniosporium apollinis TaxID=61459 RepID=A0ABQ9P3D1_9PEZI|nr:hypothetical protein H2201_001865 [Coniosporium apollinis]